MDAVGLFILFAESGKGISGLDFSTDSSDCFLGYHGGSLHSEEKLSNL